MSYHLDGAIRVMTRDAQCIQRQVVHHDQPLMDRPHTASSFLSIYHQPAHPTNNLRNQHPPNQPRFPPPSLNRSHPPPFQPSNISVNLLTSFPALLPVIQQYYVTCQDRALNSQSGPRQYRRLSFAHQTEQTRLLRTGAHARGRPHTGARCPGIRDQRRAVLCGGARLAEGPPGGGSIDIKGGHEEVCKALGYFTPPVFRRDLR
jgi:hypothetical protein